jgi:hypothetical protein
VSAGRHGVAPAISRRVGGARSPRALGGASRTLTCPLSLGPQGGGCRGRAHPVGAEKGRGGGRREGREEMGCREGGTHTEKENEELPWVAMKKTHQRRRPSPESVD